MRLYGAFGTDAASIDAADRVILVASADLPAAEGHAIARAARLNREMHLVLFNQADAAAPTGAGAWLDRFASDQILHIRRGDQADCQRVLRLILRSSICLVFLAGRAGARPYWGRPGA